MTEPRRAMVKVEANRKGLKTFVAGAGTVALFAFTPWFLGAVGLGFTGYLAYDWLRYRGKWGLRF